MKKIILFVALCSFLTSSCSKDDNGDKFTQETYKTLIIGKWKLVERQIIKSSNGEIVEFDLTNDGECSSKNSYEYTKEGKYIEKNYFNKENSEGCEEQVHETTYSINQSNSTLEVKGLVYPVMKILVLNKEGLKIKGLGHDFDKDGKEDYRIYIYKRVK